MKHKVLMTAFCIVVMCASIIVPISFEKQIPTVKVEAVSTQKKENYLVVNGEIEAANAARLTAELPVYVKELYVGVGDSVKAGDKLVALDKTTLLASLVTQGDDAAQSLAALLSSLSLQGASQQLSGLMDESGAKQVVEKYAQIPDVLVAPQDGVVTLISAKEGEITGMGTPIINICSASDLIATVGVSEASVSKVSAGQTATVTCSAYPGRVYQAVVEKIYPEARKKYSGTSQETIVDVQLRITDADDFLKPGYSAKCKIFTDQPKEMQVVNYDAVKEKDGIEYVYRYHTGRVLKQEVKTGELIGEMIEITQGVAVGDFIVTNPPKAVQSGSIVKLSKGESE